MDKIAKIELEDSKKSSWSNPENIELQKNKLKYSHHYDKLFLEMAWNEVLRAILSNQYSNLVFLGCGAGNEAAYICNKAKLKFNTVIITDISYYMLRHYREVFKNYQAILPKFSVVCNFNELPFSKSLRNHCAVAFLCLHHSESIESSVKNILEIFDNVIIFEPLTNNFLDFLSKFGLTRRAECSEYRPSRIRLSSFDDLKGEFIVQVKTFFQIPRDYLPFLSHKQGIIFKEENIKFEKIISYIYFKANRFANYFMKQAELGNMALVHIRRK